MLVLATKSIIMKRILQIGLFYDTNIPKNLNGKKFVKNLKTFFNHTDVIFICYKNNKFKKLCNFKTHKKKNCYRFVVIYEKWK